MRSRDDLGLHLEDGDDSDDAPVPGMETCMRDRVSNSRGRVPSGVNRVFAVWKCMAGVNALPSVSPGTTAVAPCSQT